MNQSRRRALLFLFAALLLFGCAKSPGAHPAPSSTVEARSTEVPVPTDMPAPEPPKEDIRIFLYGEWHSDPVCIERELALWGEHYAGGMRHLFIETSYFTAAYLNLWMATDSDEILDKLCQEWRETLAYSEDTLRFFRVIKEQYPETVFHGIDVGHQYSSTGQRYLSYLESIGQENSEAYALTKENIDQRIECGYRGTKSEAEGDAYREQCMAKNFMREYDKLNGENVMGIFGAAHATTSEQLESAYAPGTVTMAMMLEDRYGAQIRSTNLSREAYAAFVPETVVINGRKYDAECYGKYDFDGKYGYLYWEFRRIKDAYADLVDCPTTGETFRYSDFPAPVETGQVYALDIAYTDGTLTRMFFRTDGTEQFEDGYFKYLLMPEIDVGSPEA